MPVNREISPNEKLEKQWRPKPFKRTKKKSGRRQQHPLEKPDRIEWDSISQSLLSCNTDVDGIIISSSDEEDNGPPPKKAMGQNREKKTANQAKFEVHKSPSK